MFIGCNNLRTVVIPQGIERIDDEAFERCASLQTIHIMGDVKYIGYLAFSIHTSMNAFIPDSLEYKPTYDVYVHSSSMVEANLCAFGNYSTSFIGFDIDDITYYQDGILMHVPADTWTWYFPDPKSDEYIETTLSQYALLENCTLHVPKALRWQYMSTYPWRWFGHIVALEDEDTGISTDEIQPNSHDIYDLSGRKLETTPEGIYIMNGKKHLNR